MTPPLIGAAAAAETAWLNQRSLLDRLSAVADEYETAVKSDDRQYDRAIYDAKDRRTAAGARLIKRLALAQERVGVAHAELRRSCPIAAATTESGETSASASHTMTSTDLDAITASAVAAQQSATTLVESVVRRAHRMFGVGPIAVHGVLVATATLLVLLALDWKHSTLAGVCLGLLVFGAGIPVLRSIRDRFLAMLDSEASAGPRGAETDVRRRRTKDALVWGFVLTFLPALAIGVCVAVLAKSGRLRGDLAAAGIVAFGFAVLWLVVLVLSQNRRASAVVSEAFNILRGAREL